MHKEEEIKADIWLCGTTAMVSADKSAACWDEAFVDSKKKSGSCVQWTKQNFVYLRLFQAETQPGEKSVQMYLSRTDKKLFPRENWMPLYTDCSQKRQEVRKKGDDFAVNAHPFLLSGLYDWSGCTVIGYYGKELLELPGKITEDYFRNGIWAFLEVEMEQMMPFVVGYDVPKDLMREKRLCTRTKHQSDFLVEVIDSMIRPLNILEKHNGIFFNGVGKSRVTERMMLYFTLKAGVSVPEHMEIITEKVKEEFMETRWKDLTFARKYHRDACFQDYKLVRSTRIDCGLLHKEYVGGVYGGKKEWIERTGTVSLRIPIPWEQFHDRKSGGGTYEIPARDLVKAEVNVDYPSILILDQKPQNLSTDVESLQSLAETRRLRADSSYFLTAAVLYGTEMAESADAFVVSFYHALKQYKKVPSNWTKLLSPAGEPACLKYSSAQPNARVFPVKGEEIQYFEWNRVPKEGYLIARITDAGGGYNPLPTEAILPDDWFEKQTQWAFIEIEP